MSVEYLDEGPDPAIAHLRARVVELEAFLRWIGDLDMNYGEGDPPVWTTEDWREVVEKRARTLLDNDS